MDRYDLVKQRRRKPADRLGVSQSQPIAEPKLRTKPGQKTKSTLRFKSEEELDSNSDSEAESVVEPHKPRRGRKLKLKPKPRRGRKPKLQRKPKAQPASESESEPDEDLQKPKRGRRRSLKSKPDVGTKSDAEAEQDEEKPQLKPGRRPQLKPKLDPESAESDGELQPPKRGRKPQVKTDVEPESVGKAEADEESPRMVAGQGRGRQRLPKRGKGVRGKSVSPEIGTDDYLLGTASKMSEGTGRTGRRCEVGRSSRQESAACLVNKGPRRLPEETPPTRSMTRQRRPVDRLAANPASDRRLKPSTSAALDSGMQAVTVDLNVQVRGCRRVSRSTASALHAPQNRSSPKRKTSAAADTVLRLQSKKPRRSMKEEQASANSDEDLASASSDEDLPYGHETEDHVGMDMNEVPQESSSPLQKRAKHSPSSAAQPRDKDHQYVGLQVRLLQNETWREGRVLSYDPIAGEHQIKMHGKGKASSVRWVKLREQTAIIGRDIVWAKCGSHPRWPALLFDVTDSCHSGGTLRRRKGMEHVIFFGTEKSAWIAPKGIQPFFGSVSIDDAVSSPASLLPQRDQKDKILVAAVKEAALDMKRCEVLREKADCSGLDRLTDSLTAHHWVGYRISLRRGREDVKGIVRQYSKGTRKHLVAITDPPDMCPAWVTLRQSSARVISVNPEGTIPSAQDCTSCYQSLGSAAPVLHCSKCQAAYHGCCLDPPVGDSEALELVERHKLAVQRREALSSAPKQQAPSLPLHMADTAEDRECAQPPEDDAQPSSSSGETPIPGPEMVRANENTEQASPSPAPSEGSSVPCSGEPRAEPMWTCPQCISCRGCNVTVRDNPSMKSFLRCEVHHAYKKVPDKEVDKVLAKEPILLCGCCQDKFRSKNYCPTCEVTWMDEDDETRVNTMGCDLCNFWVHAKCEGVMSDEEYGMIEAGTHPTWGGGVKYACPVCRAQLQRQCLRKLDELDIGRIFAEPVTIEIAPTYFDVIKEPMDMQTMREKVQTGAYRTMQAMRSDMELMVRNCLTFNCPGSAYNVLARRFFRAAIEVFDSLKVETRPGAHADAIRQSNLMSGKAVPKAKRGRTVAEDSSHSASAASTASVANATAKKELLAAAGAVEDESAESKLDTLASYPDPLEEMGFLHRASRIWLTAGEAYQLAWMDLCMHCGCKEGGGVDELIMCIDCGEAFHSWCANVPMLTMDATARSTWRCGNCKLCEICNTAKPSDDRKLVYCEICDRSYHKSCITPSLDRIPEERWICGQCVSCKNCSKKVGPQGWSFSPTLCRECHGRKQIKAGKQALSTRKSVMSRAYSEKGAEGAVHAASLWGCEGVKNKCGPQQCPVCTQPSDEGGGSNMRCDACQHTVHSACDRNVARALAVRVKSPASEAGTPPMAPYFCCACLGGEACFVTDPLSCSAEEVEAAAPEAAAPGGDSLKSNHLGKTDVMVVLAEQIAKIQELRSKLSAAHNTSAQQFSRTKAQENFWKSNIDFYRNVIHAAVMHVSQMRSTGGQCFEGAVECARDPERLRGQGRFPPWLRSKAARFLRTERMRLARGLGEPEMLSVPKIVHRSMRAAAFLLVLNEEVRIPGEAKDLRELENMILHNPPVYLRESFHMVALSTDRSHVSEADIFQGKEGRARVLSEVHLSEAEALCSLSRVMPLRPPAHDASPDEDPTEEEDGGGTTQASLKPPPSSPSTSASIPLATARALPSGDAQKALRTLAPAGLRDKPVGPAPLNGWSAEREVVSAVGEWSDPRQCTLCRDVGDSALSGRLLPLEDGAWIHLHCATWSSEVFEATDSPGMLQGVHVARIRARLLKCSLCGDAGATLDCCNRTCKEIFHFPCAVEAGVIMCADRTTWCEAHAPMRALDVPTLTREEVSFQVQKFLRVAPRVALRPPVRPASPQTSDDESAEWGGPVASVSPVPPPPGLELSEGGCLRVGAMTVHSLGMLKPNRPGAVTSSHVFPVGFRSTRIFWKVGTGGAHDPPRRTLYVCEIVDSVQGSPGLAERDYDGALFCITDVEEGEKSRIVATTPQGAYSKLHQLLGLRKRQPGSSRTYGLNGPQFFGVGIPEVRQVLESLPECLSAALDAPQPYRYSLSLPGEHRVREWRLARANKVVGAQVNPSGCARAEAREEATAAVMIGRATRTLLRTAETSGEGGAGASQGKGADAASGSGALGGSNSFAERYRQYKSGPPLSSRVEVRRSHIHGWGLFTKVDFKRGDILVEYMGEVIRQCVADRREKKYEELGVGSCYLFRLDGDSIVDATRTGSMARFINHCCDPNAIARVILADGNSKKIAILAKRDIRRGEEVVYDYKFPLEEDKLACHCGAPNCMGSMN